MKLTKQRLKEIIREEYQRSTPPGDGFGDNDDGYPPERPFPSLGDLQSDEKYTGGTPIENLNTLIRARKELAAMSKEELAAFSKSLDAEQAAELRHLLANRLAAPMEEGDEMDLEEYGGAYSDSRYAKRADGSEPGPRSANRDYRGGPEADQSKKRMQNYRGGDPSKSPYGRSR